MNKKALVATIKKMAQELSDPPDLPLPPKRKKAPVVSNSGLGEVPGTAVPKPNRPEHPAVSQNVKIPEVSKMQTALISLATSVIKETDTKQIALQPGQAGTSPAQGEAFNRTSFADFITKHYVRQSDLPAVEFDPSPSKTKMSEKNPSQPTRMNTVMDTMQRVGGHDNEFKIDGIWGPRTNTALHNAYALAYGLLKMASDFDMTPKSYDDGQREQLKSLIPPNETDYNHEEKIDKAKQITPHIQRIIALFQEIKDGVFHNQRYRSFIEGDDALATYKKQDQPQQDPRQMQAMAPWIYRMFPQGFSVQVYNRGDAVVNGTFTLEDLSSLKRFQDALTRVQDEVHKRGVVRDQRVQVQLDPNAILQAIDRQLSDKLAEFKAHEETQAKTPKGVKQWLPPEYYAPDAPPPGRQ